jgi:hypothetical protein
MRPEEIKKKIAEIEKQLGVKRCGLQAEFTGEGTKILVDFRELKQAVVVEGKAPQICETCAYRLVNLDTPPCRGCKRSPLAQDAENSHWTPKVKIGPSADDENLP